jgi:hypothetical protein
MDIVEACWGTNRRIELWPAVGNAPIAKEPAVQPGPIAMAPSVQPGPIVEQPVPQSVCPVANLERLLTNLNNGDLSEGGSFAHAVSALHPDEAHAIAFDVIQKSQPQVSFLPLAADCERRRGRSATGARSGREPSCALCA